MAPDVAVVSAPEDLHDDETFRARCREVARRTRIEQGLPPTITDPAALGLVAEVLARYEDAVSPRLLSPG